MEDKLIIAVCNHRELYDPSCCYAYRDRNGKDLAWRKIARELGVSGECLGGALWWKDLLQLADEVGFSVPRLLTASIVTVGNEELQDILGDFKFVSATYRLFKVPEGIPEACQVIYNGGITGAEDSFLFDCRNTFKANQVVEVDGELANILKRSRFAPDFSFQPPGGSTESCCVKPKADIVDPFELAVELGSQGLSAATGGCCSTKSADCCR